MEYTGPAQIDAFCPNAENFPAVFRKNGVQ